MLAAVVVARCLGVPLASLSPWSLLALAPVGGLAGRRSVRVWRQAAFRRQGYESPHSGPWRRSMDRLDGFRAPPQPPPWSLGITRASMDTGRAGPRCMWVSDASRLSAGFERESLSPYARCDRDACWALPARRHEHRRSAQARRASATASEAVTAHQATAARSRAALPRDVNARFAAVADPDSCGRPEDGARRPPASRQRAGDSALVEAAQRPADWVMAAISGSAGLKLDARRRERGATVALANKRNVSSAPARCSACAWAAAPALRVLPVDSEHNAIFQALGAGPART